MLKLEFSTEEVEALRYWRFHHPHPHVQRKMEVVYLRSQKLENKPIQQLCGISKATFYRYLHEYQAGGVEKLKELNFHRPQSQLAWISTE
jgi:transposase